MRKSMRSLLLMVMVLIGLSSQQGAIGDYVIKLGALAEKYCQNVNVAKLRSEMANKPTDEQNIIVSHFSRPRPHVEKFISTRDYMTLLKDSAPSLLIMLGIPLLAVLGSLVCLPIILCWSICASCCSSYTKGSEKEYHKRFSLFKTIVYWSVIFLIAIVAIFTFIWAMHTASVVGSVDSTLCAFGTIVSDVSNGVDLPNTFFPGLNGLKYFGETLLAEITALPNAPQVDQIIAQELDKKGEDYLKSLSTLTNGVASDQVDGAKDGTRVQLLLVKNMVPNFISKEIQEQATLLVGYGKALHEGMKLFKNFSTMNDTKDKVSNSLKQLASSSDLIANQTTNAEKMITQDFNIPSLKSRVQGILILAGVIVAGVLVLYLLFIFVTTSLNKCLWLNCLSKIIMLVSMISGCLLSISTLVFTLLSVIFINLCFYFEKSINDPTYDIISKFGGTSNSLPVKALLDNCIYPTATGNISSIIGVDMMAPFNDAMKMLTGFSDVTPITTLTSIPSANRALSVYLKDVVDFRTFSRVLGTSVSDQDLEANLNQVNPGLSTSCDNEVQLLASKCTKNPIWQTGDAQTLNNNKGQNMCVPMPAFASTYDLRYPSGNPCSSFVLPLNRLNSAINSYTAGLQKLQNALSSDAGNPKAAHDLMFDQLTQAKNSMGVFKDALPKTKKFLNSPQVKNLFENLLNCRILRSEIMIVKGAVCGDFAHSFASSSYFLGWMGPALCLLACCMCCQLRIVKKQSEERDAGEKGLEDELF
jgi:hypothetical protein